MLNPPYVRDFCRSARWAARSRGRVQRHPDWMAIATAVLEEHGHHAWLFDASALNLDRPTVISKIRNFKPEIVVIHTTTPSIYNDVLYAKNCKEEVGNECVTVLIGAHASALPEETIKKSGRSVDIVARGEFDYTLLDISECKKFENILGISYFDKGLIKHNKDRPLIEDVNSLPFPAWHNIRPEWYWDGGKLYPFLTLISGRGCLGRCTFCRETQVMFGHKLRLRSPDLVVDEIEFDLKLYPQIKEIMFETDTFTMSPSHVRGVCQEILERGLDVTWSANARPDVVDSELLRVMRKAGCRMLVVGFEFGTQAALNAVKKGIRLETMVKFANLCHKIGIKVHGCFMVGAPNETVENALRTINFANQLPMDTVQFSALCPYPGTEFYGWAQRKGFIIAKDWTDWVNHNFEQSTVISYPQATKEQIDSLVNKGLQEFYLRPKKMLNLLLSTKELGDLKRKVYGSKSFFDYFLREVVFRANK